MRFKIFLCWHNVDVVGVPSAYFRAANALLALIYGESYVKLRAGFRVLNA
jgi:hypothetical protein